MAGLDIKIKSKAFTKIQLSRLKRDLSSERIRRFGAIVDHWKLNFSYNALVVWTKQSIDEQLASKLKEKPYISHIYIRKPHRDWPYGLYTMVHANNSEKLDSYIKEMNTLLNTAHKVLKTVKEFKKISFVPTKTKGP